MKNLENLQLQELTIEEQKNTDGGIAPLILAAWGIMAAIDVGLIAVYATYDSNGKLKHK